MFAILNDMAGNERKQIYVDGSDQRHSIGQYKAAAIFVYYIVTDRADRTQGRGGRQSKDRGSKKIGSNLGSIVWNYPSVRIFSGGFQLVCRKDHYHWYVDGSVSFYIR